MKNLYPRPPLSQSRFYEPLDRVRPGLPGLTVLLTAACWLLPATAQEAPERQPTGSVTVSCSDLGNLEDSCQILSGNFRVFNETALQLIDVIAACEATGEDSVVCRDALEQEVISCEFPTATSATCLTPGGAGVPVVAVTCDELTDDAATCTVERSVDPATQQLVNEVLEGIANTLPAREVAEVIASVCPQDVVAEQLQADCNALVGAAIGEDENAPAALAEVVPFQASVPVDAALTSVEAQSSNIRSRLLALRQGVRGVSVQGLSLHQDGRILTGEELAQAMGVRGGAAQNDASFGRLGVFVSGTFSQGERDDTDLEAGFEADTYGLTAGADYRFTDTLVAGLAFGFANTDIDIGGNGGELDMEGYTLTLYGTYYPRDEWYLEASASYGSQDFEQQRSIAYTLPTQNTIVDQTAEADFLGEQWSVSFGGGYEFTRGALSYGPVARLEYIEAEVEDYEESMSDPDAAGGGWALGVDEQDFQSLTLSLGGRLSYAASMSWGVLVPQLQVEWVKEFEDDTDFIVGRFLGDPTGTEFRLPTDEADDSYFNLTLGLSAVFAQGRSAFLYYQPTLGLDDLDYYTLGAGVRWEF